MVRVEKEGKQDQVVKVEKEAREEKEANLVDLEEPHQVKAKEKGRVKAKVENPVKSRAKRLELLTPTLDHVLVMLHQARLTFTARYMDIHHCLFNLSTIIS